MQKVEIRVRGQIDRNWSDWFGGLNISHTPEGETVLTGPIRDQAELRGMLCKLTDLGLDLTSVSTQSRPFIKYKAKEVIEKKRRDVINQFQTKSNKLVRKEKEMKKLYLVSVTAIVLAILITGTVAIAVAGSEGTPDTEVGDQSTIKIDIVYEPHGMSIEEIQEGYPGYMEYMKAMSTQVTEVVVTVPNPETVDTSPTVVIVCEPHGLCMEEIATKYPGYMEYLKHLANGE